MSTKPVDLIQSDHNITSWVYGEKHSEICEAMDLLFYCFHPRPRPQKNKRSKNICITDGRSLRNIYDHGIQLIYTAYASLTDFFFPWKQKFLTVHANKDCVSSIRQFHLNCESFVRSFCPSWLQVPFDSLSASRFFCNCLCSWTLCSFVSYFSLSISVCNFSFSCKSWEILVVIWRSPEQRKTVAVLLNLSVDASCFLCDFAWRCLRWRRGISRVIVESFPPSFTSELFTGDELLDDSSDDEALWMQPFVVKLPDLSNHSLVFDVPSGGLAFRTSQSHISPKIISCLRSNAL